MSRLLNHFTANTRNSFANVKQFEWKVWRAFTMPPVWQYRYGWRTRKIYIEGQKIETNDRFFFKKSMKIAMHIFSIRTMHWLIMVRLTIQKKTVGTFAKAKVTLDEGGWIKYEHWAHSQIQTHSHTSTCMKRTSMQMKPENKKKAIVTALHLNHVRD